MYSGSLSIGLRRGLAKDPNLKKVATPYSFGSRFEFINVSASVNEAAGQKVRLFERKAKGEVVERYKQRSGTGVEDKTRR